MNKLILFSLKAATIYIGVVLVVADSAVKVYRIYNYVRYGNGYK